MRENMLKIENWDREKLNGERQKENRVAKKNRIKKERQKSGVEVKTERQNMEETRK